MSLHICLLLFTFLEISLSTPEDGGNGLYIDGSPYNCSMVNGAYQLKESASVMTIFMQFYVKDTNTHEIVSSIDCAIDDELFAVNVYFVSSVYVNAPLDYESEPTHSMTLTCQDSVSNRSASMDIRVQLIPNPPPNTHRPRIIVYRNTDGLVYDNGHPTVRENADLGTLVAQVAAKDFDRGRGGEVECQLESPIFRLDKVFPGEYNISTYAEIDYEETTNYTLNLTCHDLGAQRLESFLEFTVYVRDEDDNAPQIMVNRFTETGEIILPERGSSQAVTVYMAVFDDDEDGQQEVECVVSRNEEVYIYVDQTSRYQYTITLAAPDNSEPGSMHNLTITCYDLEAQRVRIRVHSTQEIIPVFLPEY